MIVDRLPAVSGIAEETQAAILLRLSWVMQVFGSLAPMSMVTRETRPRCARRNLTAAASCEPPG
jgi:hypothetical protein